MEPFTTITGPAAPLLLPNIDTDVIIRVERMTSVNPGALAPFAFEALRYDDAGEPKPDFVLNLPAFREARILIAGPNFGCGSSREPAVWAVMGLGIRCVIAPSYGDIFRSNCFTNGVLPVVLSEPDVVELARLAAAPDVVTVDLAAQRISSGGHTWPFEISRYRKAALLDGLDDFQLALTYSDSIERWVDHDRLVRPWSWDCQSDVRP